MNNKALNSDRSKRTFDVDRPFFLKKYSTNTSKSKRKPINSG